MFYDFLIQLAAKAVILGLSIGFYEADIHWFGFSQGIAALTTAVVMAGAYEEVGK